MPRSPLSLLRPITHPVIVTGRDLRRYVARVSIAASLLALLLDVGNQLALFTDWPTALRSWALTVVDAGVVAVLISIHIGRSKRDLLAAKKQVEHLSRTDPLTGLPNRRAIMEGVSAQASPVMVLVIVDIDRFKSINDSYGHRSGDEVIRRVAQLMAADLRSADCVGRLGGEEFAALASRDALGDVLADLARFRARLAEAPLQIDGDPIRVTISAGAALREPGEPFDLLYNEADAALYEAKNAGRNTIALSRRLRDWQSMGVADDRRAA